MNINRRGLFGVMATALAGVAWRPARAARRWVNVDRRVDGLVERGRTFRFSGEAFDQREPILREIEAWLREAQAAAPGHDVWRTGHVTIRCRSGVGDADLANVEDVGPQPLIDYRRDYCSTPATRTAEVRAGQVSYYFDAGGIERHVQAGL